MGAVMFLIIQNGKEVIHRERAPYETEAKARKAVNDEAALYYNADKTFQIVRVVATNTPDRKWKE